MSDAANKKESRNPSKKQNPPKPERISKSMEKAFKSGCMCFFDAGKEAEFAARLKKQKEEDAKAGYVEAAENEGEDVDVSDEEEDSSNAASSSSKST